MTSPFSHRWTWIIEIFLLLVVLLSLGLYYSRDYQYPVCCDTAMTLIKAKTIAVTRHINPLSPLNPSSGAKIYGSIISGEFIPHFTLAAIYLFVPTWQDNLQIAKWFFLIVYLLSAVPVYFLLRRLMPSLFVCFATLIVLYVSFWFGNSYWTGHVAQSFALGIMALGFLALEDYRRSHQKRKIVLVALTIILLFFTHVLSFLVMLLTTLVVVTKTLYGELSDQKKVLIPIAYIIYFVLALLYLRLTPASTGLLPRFGVEPLHFSLESIIVFSPQTVPFFILMCLGAWVVLYQRQMIIISWFFVSYLLSQSTTFGAAFYPYRFNEFVIVPVIIIFGFGLTQTVSLLRWKLLKLIFVTMVLAIYLPVLLKNQNGLRACYIRNCPGLYATQIPPADIALFAWSTRLPAGTIIAGPSKFGYFIPVVTKNRFEDLAGEKLEIFTTPDPARRNALSHKYGIQYVYWGDVDRQTNGTTKDVIGLDPGPFNQPKFFRLVKKIQGATLYEVL